MKRIFSSTVKNFTFPILLAFLLAGCGDVITGEQIQEAVKFCEPHGGVKTITTVNYASFDIQARYKVVCQNGTEARLGEIMSKKWEVEIQ